MEFIWFLAALLLFIIILLAIVPIKAIISFDSNLNYFLYVTWLKQIAALITEENNHIMLSISIFKKQIYKTQLGKKEKKHSYLNLLKQIKPAYVEIRTTYGFEDPSLTGFTYLLVNMISSYFHVDEIYNKADFNDETSHINFKCLMKINIISTIFRLLTSSKASNVNTSYQH